MGAVEVREEALNVMRYCRERGIDLTAGKVGGRDMIVGLPRKKLTPRLAHTLRHWKREILRALRAEEAGDVIVPVKPARRPTIVVPGDGPGA